MTNEELQKLVECISLTFFKQPFVHQAIFNPRLKTTGGRYHLKTHNLDFNPKIVVVFGKDELIGVIKHELCHYHLHLQGLGYKHQDKDFKQLLKQVGGSRYVKNVNQKQPKYTYQCTGCQQVIYRQRRFNVSKYICSKCRHSFKEIPF
ncbi:SprT family protein [Carnobacteriaceae bacterium zg-84]|uniref:SprT family protein n=1 Tax=Granulicatella sp. zg-84 TaxID=2678503 RepID=UPI0013C2133E|nr:SprT family protein [Granulicatella sp. zg-84]NEW66151.1 SprT family protein [Granulicatella sp. zg-84]QMI86092.1 SprT family protein [Carnobacteriaceae bacterium zg-84]